MRLHYLCFGQHQPALIYHSLLQFGSKKWSGSECLLLPERSHIDSNFMVFLRMLDRLTNAATETYVLLFLTSIRFEFRKVYKFFCSRYSLAHPGIGYTGRYVKRDCLKSFIFLSFTRWKKKWSRYRPGVAWRVGRGIALLFHDRGTRRGWVVSSTPPAALYPRETPGTHFTGGWLGPRAGLDWRKFSSPPGFDPGLIY